MKSSLILPVIFCALCYATAATPDVIEVAAIGRPKITVSPEDSAYPGKRWVGGKLEITNRSEADFYVSGHSLDHVFIGVTTRDPESNEWVNRGLGYCGTGSRMFRVSQGQSFTVDVSLPIELAEREFIVDFTRYASEVDWEGTTTKTPPLRFQLAE